MPLRFPRLAMVPVAIGLAMAFVVFSCVAALADQVRHQEWWLRELQVSKAWRTSMGSGVTVAVLDTGVDASQPDLAGSVTTGPDFTRSGRTAGQPYFGINGTAVASLIAGHGHGPGNSQGVVGVAPDARILSVRVTLESRDPLLASPKIAAALPGAIATGIRYAVGQGAKVIDLPLDPAEVSASKVSASTTSAGGAGHASGVAPARGSPAEQAAVAYALSKGVVLVAPAGDNGAGSDAVNYPAAYPRVLSVGAFDKSFIKAPFSSHQPYVMLTAAGEGVIAALPSGSYAPVNSTSASSAIVAGIAALIKSQFPGLTPGQVSLALTKSTVFRRSGGLAVGSGYGTANAARALAAAATIAAPKARQAGVGAAARALPAPPPVSAIDNSLASKLEKYALISAAVLLLLLLPIAAFGALRRRHWNARRQDVDEDDGLGLVRSAHDHSSRAEHDVGFLAAPAAGTVGSLALASHARGSRGALTVAGPEYGASFADAGDLAGLGSPGRLDQPDDLDRFAGPGRRNGSGGGNGSGSRNVPGDRNGPGGLAGGPGGLASPGGLAGPGSLTGMAAGDPGSPAGMDAIPGPGGFTGSSSFSGLSPRARDLDRPSAVGHVPGPAVVPVTRPASGRSAQISGSPPWEPAAKPESEFPWAGAPAPDPIDERGPAHKRPSAGAAGAGPQLATGTGGQPAPADAGPIYVWNPGASTETFPVMAADAPAQTSPARNGLADLSPAQDTPPRPGPAEDELGYSSPAEEGFGYPSPAEERLVDPAPPEERLADPSPAEDEPGQLTPDEDQA